MATLGEVIRAPPLRTILQKRAQASVLELAEQKCKRHIFNAVRTKVAGAQYSDHLQARDQPLETYTPHGMAEGRLSSRETRRLRYWIQPSTFRGFQCAAHARRHSSCS